MNRRTVASSGMRTTVQANSDRKLGAANARVGVLVEWHTPLHPRVTHWRIWSPGPVAGTVFLIHYPDGYLADDPTSPRPVTVEARIAELLRPARGAGA